MNEVYERIEELKTIEDRIRANRHEREDLERRKKLQRDRVSEAIKTKLLTLNIGEGRDWLGELYWTSEDLSKLVNRAHREVFDGKNFRSIQEHVKACSRCQAPNVVVCKNWNDYNWSFVCEACREPATNLEEESRRRHEEYQAEVRRLRAMPYKDYLQTEHWHEVRTSALRRADYRCQLCNQGGTLDVHHRTYERRGQEAVGDVTVLCRKCHEKHHDKLPKAA